MRGEAIKESKVALSCYWMVFLFYLFVFNGFCFCFLSGFSVCYMLFFSQANAVFIAFVSAWHFWPGKRTVFVTSMGIAAVALNEKEYKVAVKE